MSNQKIRQVSYQLPSTGIQLKVLFAENSVWLTRNKIVELFVSRSEVTEPKNDESEVKVVEEVRAKCVERHLEIVCKDNKDFKYEVTRFFKVPDYGGFLNIGKNQKYYNLDIILAVGYRCDFIAATNFRRWVDEETKKHLIKNSVFESKTSYLVQIGMYLFLGTIAGVLSAEVRESLCAPNNVCSSTVITLSITLIFLGLAYFIKIVDLALEYYRFDKMH